MPITSALPCVGAPRAIVVRVQQLAAEVARPGPGGHARDVVSPHRDDDNGRAPSAAIRGHDPVAVATRDAPNSLTQAHVEPVRFGIVGEISRIVCGGNVAWLGCSDRRIGKRGERFDCVQPQAVVPASPRSADLDVTVEQDRIDAAPLERRRDRKARGSRADDDDVSARRGIVPR
jgi:hypothetical protein